MPGCVISSNGYLWHRASKTTKRCYRGTARRPLPLLPENNFRPSGRGLWSAYIKTAMTIAEYDPPMMMLLGEPINT